MKIKKKTYGILITILLISIAIGVIIIKPMIETRELYNWAQSLDVNQIEVATIGAYSLSLEEKKELVNILKGMSRRDFSLLDEGAIGDGCEYCIYIMVDGEKFSIWRSYVRMYDAAMTYKGRDYTFNCEELNAFMKEIMEKHKEHIYEY